MSIFCMFYTINLLLSKTFADFNKDAHLILNYREKISFYDSGLQWWLSDILKFVTLLAFIDCFLQCDILKKIIDLLDLLTKI